MTSRDPIVEEDNIVNVSSQGTVSFLWKPFQGLFYCLIGCWEHEFIIRPWYWPYPSRKEWFYVVIKAYFCLIFLINGNWSDTTSFYSLNFNPAWTFLIFQFQYLFSLTVSFILLSTLPTHTYGQRFRIRTIQAEFPLAVHRGCYFHFMLAIFRQLQHLGLIVLYKNDDNICAQVRQLMAISNKFVQGRTDQRFVSLFDYFARQWLHNAPLEMWNVYDLESRTNTDLEEWHFRFNSLVNKHHPDTWKLI